MDNMSFATKWCLSSVPIIFKYFKGFLNYLNGVNDVIPDENTIYFQLSMGTQ